MNDYPTDHLNAESHGVGGLNWSTNMPNPVHDVDDDDADGRWEEAEVTADNSSFPTANYGYIYTQEFTRWHTTHPPYWQWDSGSGTIAHLSQMSYWFFEWQAADWTSIYWNTNYPTKSPPSAPALMSAEGSERQLTVASPESTSPAIVSTSVDGPIIVMADTSGGETDIYVSRSPLLNVADYIRTADDRAESALSRSSTNEVVITFSRPLSVDEFMDLFSTPGLGIEEYEAVGTKGGHTWTYGGSGIGVHDLESRARADGATLLGVVAANGWISARSAYDRLHLSETVALVDFAPALARNATLDDAAFAAAIGSDKIDVVMNDVYWDLAGLTE